MRALTAAFVVLLHVGLVAEQAPTGPPKATRPWAPPRTPDGQPDIEGIWTNGTSTPFERAAALANKAFLTEDEAAALERQNAEQRAAAQRVRKPGEVGNDNEAFMETYSLLPTRQASLVVDPPDGRVPLLPSAERARDFNLASTDNYESLSPWDRCVTRGPTGLFPAAYNNGFQIVQTRGYVVIAQEMIHEARVIPIDGRPHLPPTVKLWTGDSRGRWEGTTLVVETTHFHNKGWIATNAGAGRIRGVPHSEALRLVERFRRSDADTLQYDVTVHDSNVYAKPWTFSIPLTRDDGYRMFEYACHEANLATELTLRGARTLEKEAAAAAGPR
jgi:hypothetical protein